MKSKNSVTILLMISSMALLLALQVFWIQKVFEDEKDTLQKEVSNTLKNILYSMQDSLIQSNIHSVAGDSSSEKLLRRNHIRQDSVFTRRPMPDSMLDYLNLKDRGAKIQIFVSESSMSDESDVRLKNDSLYRIVRPMITRISKDKGHRNFVLRLGMDSLRIADISNKYKNALLKIDIDLPFEIKRMRGMGVGFSEEGISIASEPVSFSPVDTYISFFHDLQYYLLRKIKAEILFSIFILVVTASSFSFMYRSIRAQQRLMALKNDFISNVTHELKTPIATVSVALEALKNFKGIDNPIRTGEYLDIAQHELNRLAILADKVLTTSIFDEHGIKITYEKADLGKIVDEAVNSMKLIFDKQKATVELDKKGDGFSLEGSPIHLTNVVYNLLDNALKYSPSNPVIAITIANLGNKISLTVADKGLGIPLEYHKKIFEKFFRMPTGDIHNIKGYGLGLSYVDSVVKSHRGTITLASQPGAGSKFTITLPKTRS